MKPNNIPHEFVASPHTVVWTAHVFAPSGAMVDVMVEDGTVTLSGRERNRTRGDVTLVDPQGRLWDPTGLTGASPYGGWVEVCAQMAGEECYVGSGIILEVQRERPGGTIRVAFTDFGVAAGWDQFSHPVSYAATDNLQSTIETLLESARLTATIVDPGVPTTLAGAFTEERSRESAIGSICSDADIVAWVDEHRRLRLQPESVTAAMPAVYMLADGPGGTVTQESHGLSRDGVPNYVVVTGERPQDGGDPPWGAWSLEGGGPLDPDGPFGRVVQLANRPVLATQAACEAAAKTILGQEGRLVRDISVSAIAFPCLEPGDRIDFTSGGSTLPTILAEVRYAIGPDVMAVRLQEAL